MVFVVQATTPTQESVPLDLVLLTGTSSHTQQRRLACPASRVPPLLQGLVVHIADFVPNLAETSVRNVLWGESFSFSCGVIEPLFIRQKAVTTSYSTLQWDNRVWKALSN